MFKKNIFNFMVLALMLFNVLDVFFTTYLIENNLGVELNPIIDFLISVDIKLFVLVKFIAIILIYFIFWNKFEGENKKMYKIGILVCFIPYALLTIYYCVGFFLMWHNGVI